MADVISPEQELIQAMRQKASASDLGDNFRIKVFRKTSMQPGMQIPVQVATFGQGCINHVANLETWLPRALGGGPIFQIGVYHESEPAIPVGKALQVTIPVEGNPPRTAFDVDLNIVNHPTWAGPLQILWPTPDDRPKAPENTSYPYSIPSPAVSPSPFGSTAANNGIGAGGQPPGAVPQPSASDAEVRMLRAQMERMKDQMYQQQAEVERDRRDLELQKMRDEQELRLKDMSAKMELALAQAREHRMPEKPALDVPALLSAGAPIIAALMQSQNATREMMARQQQDAQQQFQQLMAAMMNRPVIDPQVQTIIEKVSKRDDGGEAQIRMMHTMMESMSAMQANYVDMIGTLADFGLGGGRGEEEPVAMKAIRQAVKAMGSMMAGMQQTKQAPAPAQPQGAPQQLPPGHAAPQQATVHPFPKVAEGPVPKQPTAIEHIESLIRAKHPISEVVEVIFANFADPSVQQALEEAEGDFNELVARRLSDWVPLEEQNQFYLGELIGAVTEKARALGLYDDGEGDTDAQEPDEAEATDEFDD